MLQSKDSYQICCKMERMDSPSRSTPICHLLAIVHWKTPVPGPQMPYRFLCNDVQQEGVKPSPELASGLFCYVPLHEIGYGICPHPITHYYVQQSDSLLIDGWDDWIEDIQKRLSEVNESQEEVDELQEIEEYDSDGEPLLFALGHMHCIACERRKTVPGSLMCQECIDKQKTLDRESNRDPRWVPLFQLGRIIATRGAIETMERRGIDYNALLARHVTGDWGDLVEEDKHENELAVKHGQRIHSAYGT